MFLQQYDSTASEVWYACSLVHLVTATDVFCFGYKTTQAPQKDSFLTQNRKRLNCLNFSFLAWPSFTLRSNGILADQNWYGFQKEGNFYCLRASCVNNGYENELLLSVQNKSRLIDMSCSLQVQQSTQRSTLWLRLKFWPANTKICTQTWSVTDIKLPSNKLIWNIYQNLISTDVQFMAKNVLITPAACLNHWYQINTIANTL
jgi:hypothetical protein